MAASASRLTRTRGQNPNGAPEPRTVRLALDRSPHLELDSADGERVAFPELQAFGKSGIHQRSPRLVRSRQSVRQGDPLTVAPPRLYPAEQRVPVVDRLELDEHARLGIRAARHGAHLREVGQRLRRLLQETAVVGSEVLVDGAQGEIAPEYLATVGAQAGDDGARGRLHPGDGGDPEREAAEKYSEPAQRTRAVAQLPAREPKRDGGHGVLPGTDGATVVTVRTGARSERRHARRHSASRAPRPGASTRPSVMRMVRPHRAASRASWVISTRAAPLSRLREKRWSMTCSPVARSRLPVGSSARTRLGRLTRAPRDGDPLLLAAGELSGIVSQPVPQAHDGQLLPGSFEGVGFAGELARCGHILHGGHGGDEVERLEDDAHVPPAESREAVLVQGAEVVAGHRDLPAGRPFQTADDHEQGGLARTGRPDHTHRLAGRQVEVDAAQDLHRSRRTGQCDAQTAQRYDGAVGGVPGCAARTFIPAAAGMTIGGDIRHGGWFPGVQADVVTVLRHGARR